MSIRSEILQYWDKYPNKPASHDQMKALETLAGRTLPLDYRNFLLQTGPKPFDIVGWCELTVTYEGAGDDMVNLFSLGWLYGPDQICQTQKSFAEPMEFLDDVGPRIPPYMLAIGDALARTSGLLLLNVSQKDYGSVWAWERVDKTWGTRENQLVGFVAPSFYAMLDIIALHR